jgi:ubiquinone/menaquinone biosynthesis C-methylase UbiE
MSYTKEQAHDQFQKWSRSYDRSVLQWLFFKPSHRLVLEHLARCRARNGVAAASKPVRLLDVGCGTGRFAQRVHERNNGAESSDGHVPVRFWGVDFCRPMLDHAIARGLPATHFTWVQGESQQLPFADDSFDVITCVHSFHHYPDQAGAVREMFRVLAPGGRAIILDAYRDRPWGWFLYDVAVVSVEGNVQHASARHFRELFAQAGFKHVRQFKRTGLTPMLLTRGIVPLRSKRPVPQQAARLVHASV